MINKKEWFFIVRCGSNERLTNRSGDINVCREYHLKSILPALNRHGNTWEALSIERYEELFNEYMDRAEPYVPQNKFVEVDTEEWDYYD